MSFSAMATYWPTKWTIIVSVVGTCVGGFVFFKLSARRKKQKSEAVVVAVPDNNPNDTNDIPPNSDTTTQFFQRYTLPCDSNLPDNCIICMKNLSSPYSSSLETVMLLVKCRHPFHKSCLKALLMSTTSRQYIQCPLCKLIHGVKLGNQPPGTMSHFVVLPQQFSGYEDYGTICIVYNFKPGIQGPEHPKPGENYYASGFPRYCFLPDSDLGKKVLRLLIVAWQRRLVFTIGQSPTTSLEDTVICNEIHHKTEQSSNYYGHGNPDPNYLNSIQYELAAQGVTDEDLA